MRFTVAVMPANPLVNLRRCRPRTFGLFIRQVGVLGLLLLLACPRAAIGPAAASDGEPVTLRSMYLHGLVDSAVDYCQRQRRLYSDDEDRYARWTMRLMESQAQRALRTAGDSSQDQWQACQQTRDEFRANRSSNRRLPWVDWQAARCQLLQAQAELARYLAAPANKVARNTALHLVREILSQLEELDDDLQRRQPLAARQSLQGGDQAPAEELLELSLDKDLLRCEALLIRARLYPSGSPDEIAAATDVDSSAREVLVRAPQSWPARSKLQVAFAAAKLRLGKQQAALNELQSLTQSANDRTTRVRAATIAIEAAIEARNLGLARGLVDLLSEYNDGPEALLARIQLAVAELPPKATSADPTAGQRAAIDELVEQVQQLGSRYGDYWRLRGEALLLDNLDSDLAADLSPGNVQLMQAQVRQLLAAEDTQGAVSKLLEFRDNEAAVGRNATALRMAMQAAALLQREREWLPAAAAVEQIALQSANQPTAPKAHYLAISSLSNALRSEPANQQLQQRYLDLLQQHLRTWPEDAVSRSGTADPSSETPSLAELVQRRLTLWLDGQGRFVELAAAWQERAMRAKSTELASRCLLHWMALTLSVSDNDTQRLVSQLQNATQQKGFPNVPSSNMARAAIAAVQLLATWQDQATAKQALQDCGQAVAMVRQENAATPWQQVYLTVSLLEAVRNRDTVSAQTLTREWQPSSLPVGLASGCLPAFVEAISFSELDPGNSRAKWVQRLTLDDSWALQPLGLSRTTKPDEDIDGKSQPASIPSQATLQQKAAGLRIMAWSGRVREALSGLRRLAESHPRNGDLQLQLAAVMAEADVSNIAESIRICRRVAASSRPNSDLHWAARYQLMRYQILSGKQAEAIESAQLILATQAITSSIWRNRFEAIASR